MASQQQCVDDGGAETERSFPAAIHLSGAGRLGEWDEIVPVIAFLCAPTPSGSPPRPSASTAGSVRYGASASRQRAVSVIWTSSLTRPPAKRSMCAKAADSGLPVARAVPS